MSEPTAALVTLQRLPPVFPPANYVIAAPVSRLPAAQCSGKLTLLTLRITL
ncbi:MAG: hypothetical protein R3E39_19260 [Anaerolineae bacterium]